jgi:hypothetical protein
MKDFVNKQQQEARRKIEQIEAQDINILKKSLDASHVLGEAFDCLKEFIIAYRFRDESEEILFFLTLTMRHPKLPNSKKLVRICDKN